MKFVLTIGNTETAAIDGISAAGANPDLMVHTPSADAEILTYGQPVGAPVVPVSPTGCPTPAVVSRAVRECLDFETVVVDAGAASDTVAPTVELPGADGNDVREDVAVPAADEKFETAREFGRQLPDEEVFVAETIPGGTTTALGVLTALGERTDVSSSLPDNPIELKRDVVREGLAASDVEPGDTAGDPIEAVRAVGDPVLAAVAGFTVGALESGTDVTLGGGTQLSTAAALVRHVGVDEPLGQATTSFIAADDSAGVRSMAEDFGLDLTVTDPAFDATDHPAMDAFVRGEAKEGVGMGGALALAARSETGMAAVRERVVDVYDRLLADMPDEHPAASHAGTATE
ncbi:MAG: nicotinate mononucleotide-dependent phosphoribosyltransferase CobT [Haloarculaceae archaeon]